MTASRSAKVAVLAAVSAGIGCLTGYIFMRAITSGHFNVGASRAFSAILIATIGVYLGISLTLLWRGIATARLLVILGGLLIVLPVGAILAEIGYCHFDRNDCFNL